MLNSIMYLLDGYRYVKYSGVQQLCPLAIATVRDYIPEYNSSMVICDFEKASRNALFLCFAMQTLFGTGSTSPRPYTIKYTY